MDRYPLVDADFVGETLDRVLQDQSRIAAEAARVEDVCFAHQELAALEVPAPSPGFVEATLEKALAERQAGRWSADASEHDFQEFLHQHLTPPPTAGFVDRTLEAVLTDRRPERDSRRAPPGRMTTTTHREWRRAFSIVASIAALVLCSIALLFGPAAPAPESLPARSTPVSFAALITTSADTLPTPPDDHLGTLTSDPFAFFATTADSLEDRRR